MRPDTAKEKKLIDNLHSKDQAIVLETINILRHEGKVNYIPFIIELLKNTSAGEIRNSLIAFLNDLKYQGAVSELVNAVQNDKYKSERGIILSACWQSGLDFSMYLEIFIMLCITENCQNAIEAFSVVEHSISQSTKKEITDYIIQIKSHLNRVNREKKLMLVEMINMMEEVNEVV
ncbi:MAG: hypothetical protein GH151_06480 [Bacteroidetes bacterium]|nr:hypothetical protein [Bacteroidota bacterium]